jgi:organic radical activating enzyme
MRIVEIFKSIQGEGSNFGKQVIFIRLGNCNLKCPWCDTEWNKYKEFTIQEIINEISKYKCKNVIITGGEPTISNLTPLLIELKNKGYWIAIETNGTNNINYTYIDYIATSPKFIYGANIVKLKEANEVRIVVDTDNKMDFITFCINIKNKIKAKKHFLSPVEIDGEFKNLELLGEIKQELEKRGAGEWEISIQLHKLMKIQ